MSPVNFDGVWALAHRDRFEVGSFVLEFRQGDVPPDVSSPLPFGEGPSVTALVDTLYAGELRPADYLRRQRARKPAWVRNREAAEEAARLAAAAAEAAARAAELRRRRRAGRRGRHRPRRRVGVARVRAGAARLGSADRVVRGRRCGRVAAWRGG